MALVVNENSYISLADAEVIVDDFFSADGWRDGDDASKARALIEATRRIDRLAFRGSKASEAQDLQFPRKDDSEVPNDIKIATCYCACSLMDGIDPDEELADLNTTSSKYANVSTSKSPASTPSHILAGIPSVIAWRYIVPYLRDPQNIRILRSN